MTNDNNSLLAHLVLDRGYTNQVENLATDTLAYILNESKEAKHVFRKMLLEGGARVGEVTRVQTQVHQADGSIPDLIAYDKQGAPRVITEAKFDAALGWNQVSSYFSLLPEDGKSSVLLILAPEARRETIWDDVVKQMGQIGRDARGHQDADGIRSVHVGGQLWVMQTSWKTLLGRMAAYSNLDLGTLADIRQLQPLCEQLDEEAFAPVKAEELGPEVPGLSRLIDHATERAMHSGHVHRDGLNRTRKPHGYGRYLRLGDSSGSGSAVAWFGINSTLWGRALSTPVWLMFVSNYKEVDLNEVRRKLEPLGLSEVRQRGWVGPNVPVEVPTDSDYDAVVARLQEIADIIRGATP